jgi:hypothetical protein
MKAFQDQRGRLKHQTIYATVDDRAGIKESLENNNMFRKPRASRASADSDGTASRISMSPPPEPTPGTRSRSAGPRSDCSNRGASS